MRFVFPPVTFTTLQNTASLIPPPSERGWSESQINYLRNLVHRTYIAAFRVIFEFCEMLLDEEEYGQVRQTLHTANEFFRMFSDVVFWICRESEPSAIVFFLLFIDSLAPPIDRQKIGRNYFAMLRSFKEYQENIRITEGLTEGSTICIHCSTIYIDSKTMLLHKKWTEVEKGNQLSKKEQISS